MVFFPRTKDCVSFRKMISKGDMTSCYFAAATPYTLTGFVRPPSVTDKIRLDFFKCHYEKIPEQFLDVSFFVPFFFSILKGLLYAHT